MITFTPKSAFILPAVVSLFCIPAFGQVTKTEDQKLIPSDLGEGFGSSVALDGDTAIIGTPYEDDSGLDNNGAAYVFARAGGVWTEQAKLLASERHDSDQFGLSVALDGDTAVIGATGDEYGGIPNSGAAYVFTRSGGLWTEQAKLLASDREHSDFFGYSAALDAATAIIATHQKNGDSGAAYVFDVSWLIPAIDIAIDIKPGNKRNVINPRAKGGIWVAILSDTNADSPFDPLSQVDIPTVEFGPDGARALRYKVKDKNRDGLGDLLLRFKIPETGTACGDTEATLIGDTFDGQSITGTDAVKTVGCKKAKNAKNKKNKKNKMK